MDLKQTRQQAIERLINEGRYGDQLSLVEALSVECGISATQAMVSRDLKELRVIRKIDEQGRYYAIAIQEVEKEILRRAVRRLVHNHSLIAIHTLAGLADFVGDQIDKSSLKVMGCLAGENIVFVAPIDVKEIDKLMQELREFLCQTS